MANHLSYDVLSRLVERRATPVDSARAQRHLVSCGRCRSELAWLERIGSLPQRSGDRIESEQSTESVGDGWGNLGRRPAAGEPSDFWWGQPPRASYVSSYWMQNGQSTVLNQGGRLAR
jgi:hypothetical protein